MGGKERGVGWDGTGVEGRWEEGQERDKGRDQGWEGSVDKNELQRMNAIGYLTRSEPRILVLNVGIHAPIGMFVPHPSSETVKVPGIENWRGSISGAEPGTGIPDKVGGIVYVRMLMQGTRCSSFGA